MIITQNEDDLNIIITIEEGDKKVSGSINKIVYFDYASACNNGPYNTHIPIDPIKTITDMLKKELKNLG